MTVADECGLNGTGNVKIPLTGVTVKAECVDFIAEVSVIQCYKNNESNPIEAVYTFPLDEAASVCGFKAEYEDGRVIEGQVKEKETAKKEYEEAVESGKQAQLLEESRPDVFTLNVGRLPPSQHIKITITYVTLLKAEGDSSRFLLPTRLAQRYSPTTEAVSERVPAITSTNVVFYGLDIAVKFTCRSPIKSVSSPSHSQLSIKTEGNSSEASMSNIAMDRDLIILCEEEKPHEARASIEVLSDGSACGFVTLFPKIEFRDVEREIVFIIDRSGSMGSTNHDGGTLMDQAKEALQLFLRVLPDNCTFDIVSFGNNFSRLFDTPTAYTNETLRVATEHVDTMKSDMGGTEIKRPLSAVLAETRSNGARERQVFILTDGQISNSNEVFQLINESCRTGNNRVFAMGIGENVSHNLVEGIAREGNGTARFVSKGDDMRAKVLGQLKQAIQPSLSNVNIKWNMPELKKERAKPSVVPAIKTLLGYRSPEVDSPAAHVTSIRNFPTIAPRVFDSERFLSFALFPSKEGSTSLPDSVTVTAQTPDGPLSTTINITDDDIFQGNIAHRLCARQAIRDYEEGGKGANACVTKKEALDFALRHRLASQQTSFIAVDLSPPDVEAAALPMEYRVVPQTIPESSPPRQMMLACCAMPAASMPMPLCGESSSPPMRRVGSIAKKCSKGRGGGSGSGGVLAAAMSMFSKSAAPCKSAAPEARLCSAKPQRRECESKMELSVDRADQLDRACEVSCSTTSSGPSRSAAPVPAQACAAAAFAKENIDCNMDDEEEEDEGCGFGLFDDADVDIFGSSVTQQVSKGNVGTICMLQQADGSFSLTSELSASVGCEDARLHMLISQVAKHGFSETVCVTIIVLAFLRAKFAADKDVWEMLDMKALRWLEKQGCVTAQTCIQGVVVSI